METLLTSEPFRRSTLVEGATSPSPVVPILHPFKGQPISGPSLAVPGVELASQSSDARAPESPDGERSSEDAGSAQDSSLASTSSCAVPARAKQEKRESDAPSRSRDEQLDDKLEVPLQMRIDPDACHVELAEVASSTELQRGEEQIALDLHGSLQDEKVEFERTAGGPAVLSSSAPSRRRFFGDLSR